MDWVSFALGFSMATASIGFLFVFGILFLGWRQMKKNESFKDGIMKTAGIFAAQNQMQQNANFEGPKTQQ